VAGGKAHDEQAAGTNAEYCYRAHGPNVLKKVYMLKIYSFFCVLFMMAILRLRNFWQ
jgi:hypothetical protein